MNAPFKALVAIAGLSLAGCAMLSLAGCAMPSRPALEASSTERERAASSVRTCEKEIYYLSSADNQSALRCATLLDIWR
jgi:hypothetical protein